MNQLVEKIFNIEFKYLENFKFPRNELFGLVVVLKEVKYEFLLYLKEDYDKLLCIGSGAFNAKTAHDRLRPRFDRWSWAFEDSRIFYNDPTLYLSDDIYAPWGIGTENDWYLKNIADIIDKISKNIKINSQNIIFFGSSAGGFTSILLSILIKNSVALAEIPQLDVSNWGDHWKPIKKAGFSSMSDDKFINEFGYRLKVFDLINKEKYIPNAYFLLNCGDSSEFSHQFLPFFEKLDRLPFYEYANNLKIIINGENKGHVPSSMNNILYHLDNIKYILDKNYVECPVCGGFLKNF